MQRRILTVGACATLLAAAACSDFLSGPGLTENPNRPSSTGANQLFIGVQVQTFSEFTGSYPLQLLPMYVRQFAGVNRQWQTYANFSNGGPSETDADGAFINTYAQGGLGDIRTIEAQARLDGNDELLGIAEVYEALRIGMAASLFTAIPYSQALGDANPTLDAPTAVLDAVQKVLDSAIVHLESGRGGVSADLDFAYASDNDLWVQAAHTLKARYYAHTANVPGTNQTELWTRVQQEALLGIRSHEDDWVARFTSTAGEQNLYYNFLNSRSGDIEPDDYYIGLLRARGETARLDSLYEARTGGSCTGQYLGATQGTPGGACAATFDIEATTPVSILTAAENEMLLAEAQYRLGSTGPALTTLNAYRTSIGRSTVSPAGANLLVAILTEKYIRNYLNPEVYFDYLRTCVPNFPISYAVTSHPYVPARFPYGYTERITNTNIPEAGGPENNDYANPLFPKLAADPVGAACAGQVNRPT